MSLCALLLTEDVDSRAAAIRIKAGRPQRTKACIVGRNSASAFEEQHQEASRSTASAERCQSKWNPFGRLICCVHSDACSSRMLMLQGCSYVCFTLKLCVQCSASYTLSSSWFPASPVLRPMHSFTADTSEPFQRSCRHLSIFLSFPSYFSAESLDCLSCEAKHGHKYGFLSIFLSFMSLS